MASSELSLEPHIAQWTVQALGRGLAFLAIIAGLNIVLTGHDRWSTPEYTSALAVPGAPATWGYLLMLTGLLALYGSLRGKYRWLLLGHAGVGFWGIFFSFSFAKAATSGNTIPNGGFFVYLGLAFAAIAVAMAYWKSARTSALRP